MSSIMGGGGRGVIRKVIVVGALAAGAMSLGGAVARNPDLTKDAKEDVCNALAGINEGACETEIDINFETNDGGSSGPVHD